MTPVVRMIACHYANRSGRGVPATFLQIDTVRDMVEAGLAVWDRRCKYVNFTKTEAEIHRNAQSLTMHGDVTVAACEGSGYHMSLVEGWRPLLRIATWEAHEFIRKAA